MASKRIFDVVVAALLLIVLLPLIFLIVAAVRISMGSPVLFVQTRPGLGGKPFELVKFRTMRTSGGTGVEQCDAERLTHFGRLLRRSSLDELPELWNVLKGEMSLVGPRPLLMEYLPLYNQQQMRRHDIRPGVTGWAQVNGRNAVSWEQRFALDVWYVENRSWWLDLRILWLTGVRVLQGAGVSQPGQATVDRYTGAGT